MTRDQYVNRAKDAALKHLDAGDPQRALMELICNLGQQRETDDLNVQLQRSLLFADLLLKPEPRRVREYIGLIH